MASAPGESPSLPLESVQCHRAHIRGLQSRSAGNGLGDSRLHRNGWHWSRWCRPRLHEAGGPDSRLLFWRDDWGSRRRRVLVPRKLCGLYTDRSTGWAADKIGRKKGVAIGAVFCLLGSALMSSSVNSDMVSIQATMLSLRQYWS